MKETSPVPRINLKKCTGCGLCTEVCPIFLLELRGRKAAVVEAAGELCNNCGHCGAVCPVGAIAQKSREEKVISPLRNGRIDAEALQFFLRRRRSIRLYKKQPVPREIVAQIIEAGRYAPTGGNRQDVHYLVLDSPARIAELGDLVTAFLEKGVRAVGHRYSQALMARLGSKEMAENAARYTELYRGFQERRKRGEDRLLYHAPVVILVHSSLWDTSSAFNCAVALYSAALSSHALGLGTCFNGFLQVSANLSWKIKKFLGIPRSHLCYGTMTLGYPRVSFKRLVKRAPAKVRYL
jgi:nitroreductase/NAD-dependent dihydropyrimidine dehydrogenase PreA subunit